MPRYLGWLEFLASLPPVGVANFLQLQVEVRIEGDRLIWVCSHEALRSELIEPVLHQIPRILEHGFLEFRLEDEQGHGVFFSRRSLELLAGSL